MTLARQIASLSNQYFDQAHLETFSYYLDALHSHPALVTVDRFGSLGARTEYTHQVRARTLLGGSWQLQYKYSRFPRSIDILSNTLMFQLTLVL